jgi:SAM-dependent methyltransferase
MPGFDELLEEAERRPLVGWDVSYGGRISHKAPWNFEAFVDARIGDSPDLLDMGTGGGEWLSRRPFPRGRTTATEGWPPNVPTARARLAPLGVAVVAVVGAPDNADQADAGDLPALPFADAAFHLVLNRHEAFVASEVARVLAPGGRFLTQQIGADMGAPFRKMLGLPSPPAASPWSLAVALRQVRAAGFYVEQCDEGAAQLRFADVGALAWYLSRLPWVMPEFEIARCREQLEALSSAGPITAPQPMFWLHARKPG